MNENLTQKPVARDKMIHPQGAPFDSEPASKHDI